MEPNKRTDENNINYLVEYGFLILKSLFSFIPNIVNGTVLISSTSKKNAVEYKIFISTSDPVLILVYKKHLLTTETYHYDNNAARKHIYNKNILPASPTSPFLIDARCSLILQLSENSCFHDSVRRNLSQDQGKPIETTVLKDSSFTGNRDGKMSRCVCSNILDDIFSIILTIVSGTALISSEINQKSLDFEISASFNKPILILRYMIVHLVTKTFRCNTNVSKSNSSRNYSSSNIKNKVKVKSSSLSKQSASVKCLLSENSKFREAKNSHKQQNSSIPCKYSFVHKVSSSVQRQRNIGKKLFSFNPNKKTCVQLLQSKTHKSVVQGRGTRQIHTTDGICKMNRNFKEFDVNNKKNRIRKKLFKCSHCDKLFYYSSSLKAHLRHHSGVKPYKCQFCEKSFSILSNAKRHEKIHLGEKPYKCEFCEKSFSDASNLKKHERTHS